MPSYIYLQLKKPLQPTDAPIDIHGRMRATEKDKMVITSKPNTGWRLVHRTLTSYFTIKPRFIHLHLLDSLKPMVEPTDRHSSVIATGKKSWENVEIWYTNPICHLIAYSFFFHPEGYLSIKFWSKESNELFFCRVHATTPAFSYCPLVGLSVHHI